MVEGDVIIIGAGIVGLATALRLTELNPRRKILVIEKEADIAQHQTGHNSGVIHSGIYYKPGSLKATHCFNGYRMLLDFCRRHDVPFDICGKVIVATDERETGMLYKILDNGTQNGLQGLRLLSREELKEREVHVAGQTGIFVPQTGIIDFKAVAQKYAQVLQGNGAEIILGHKVVDIRQRNGKVDIITNDRTFTTALAINCAGLYSDKIARLTHPGLHLKIVPFRGEYYNLRKDREHLVRNLIYPVPDPSFPFLGVHFTRQLRGGVEAGPNAVLAMKREGYKKSAFNFGELVETLAWPGFRKVARRHFRTGMGEMYRSLSKAAFARALQKLIPEITVKDLVAGGAGVRAQACDRSGKLIDDFVILESHGVINVCNAPSPAATSSLAIGDTIARMAEKQLGV